MRLFRTIILGILAAAAVFAAVFQTKEGSLGRLLGRGAFTEGENLFSFSPRKADLIIIRSGDTEALFTKQENGVWWASKPWDDRMDPRAAEAIVQFSLGTRVVDVLPLNNTVRGQMREFGVENSPIEVILKDKGEHSLARYKLGNLAPWGIPPETDKDAIRPKVYMNTGYEKWMHYYFEVLNNISPVFKDAAKPSELTPTIYLKTNFYQWMQEIFVVSGNITPLFKDGLRYLRDHRPLYFNPNALSKIEIKADGKDLVLSRSSAERDWILTTPREYKTDKKVVNNLIGVLQQMTARKVSDPEDTTILEKNSPDNKQITLSFLNGAPPVTLTIYPQDKPADQTVMATVSDRKAIFALPVNPAYDMPGVRNLALTQKLLRAKNMVDIDRVQLNAISLRLAQEETSIILRKTNNKWLYSESGGSLRPLNEQQLFNLLATLSLEPVQDFATDSAVDLELFGLNSPLYTLTFGFDIMSPLTIFIGFDKVDGQFYALVDGDSTIYKLSGDYIAKLGLQPHSWKPLNLFSHPGLVLTGIVAESKDSEPFRLEGEFMEEKWKATLGGRDVTAQLNPHKATIYMQKLGESQVVQWLSPTNQAAREALKNPAYTLTLILKPFLPDAQGGEVTEKLRIAPVSQLSGLYYGEIEGTSEYFLINSEVVELFKPNLFESATDDQ